MSGFRSITTPLLLYGPFRVFAQFCVFLPPLFNLFLLGPCRFSPLLCPSLYEMFPWYLQFSWRDLYSFPLYCFPLFLCIVHVRLYLSLIFSATLHSFGPIFPFFFCLSLLFPQLFVRPQTTSDNFAFFIFLGGGFGHHLLYSIMNLCLQFIEVVPDPWQLVHSCSGTLPDLIPWIYWSPPLYNHKRFEFDLGYIWMA